MNNKNANAFFLMQTKTAPNFPPRMKWRFHLFCFSSTSYVMAWWAWWVDICVCVLSFIGLGWPIKTIHVDEPIEYTVDTLNSMSHHDKMDDMNECEIKYKMKTEQKAFRLEHMGLSSFERILVGMYINIIDIIDIIIILLFDTLGLSALNIAFIEHYFTPFRSTKSESNEKS